MPVYQVTFELVDAFQRLGRKTWETEDVADEAAALANAAALATDLANLTMMDILAYNVSQRVVYTDTVDAGANRDEGVTFQLRKADNYRDDIKVPAPIVGIFNTDGSVNLAHAAVTAFISNFLTGGGFTFSDGEQGTVLLKGSLDK